MGSIAHAAFMYETAAKRLWAGDAGSNRAVRWSSNHWIQLMDAGTKALIRVRVSIAECYDRGDDVTARGLEACASQIEKTIEVVTRWGFDGMMPTDPERSPAS